MENIRTISCRLDVTDYQALHIEATMQAFADACNYIADWGREHQISRQEIVRMFSIVDNILKVFSKVKGYSHFQCGFRFLPGLTTGVSTKGI